MFFHYYVGYFRLNDFWKSFLEQETSATCGMWSIDYLGKLKHMRHFWIKTAVAPEVLFSPLSCKYSKWWSVGCIIYELLRGVVSWISGLFMTFQPPFGDGKCPPFHVALALRSKAVPDFSSIHFDENAKDLILQASGSSSDLTLTVPSI